MSKTREIIAEYAGTLRAEEIARLAGVVPGRIRVVAHEMGISLRVPSTVTPKRIYYISAPEEEVDIFAKEVKAIMRALGIRTQSRALYRAARFMARAIEDAEGALDELKEKLDVPQRG